MPHSITMRCIPLSWVPRHFPQTVTLNSTSSLPSLPFTHSTRSSATPTELPDSLGLDLNPLSIPSCIMFRRPRLGTYTQNTVTVSSCSDIKSYLITPTAMGLRLHRYPGRTVSIRRRRGA